MNANSAREKMVGASDALSLARQRLLRVTSRLLLWAWVPLMLASAVSVWERPAVRNVVLLTAATIAAAGLVLWRPSARYASLQASLFLGLLTVGIPAAGGVTGITPTGMATGAVLVAWAALFFGNRGVYAMLLVMTLSLGYTAWEYSTGRLTATVAPDLRSVGYWGRNVLFLLTTFVLGGLIVRAAISAYDETLAAERAARVAAAEEERARMLAEAEALLLQRRESASSLAAGLAHDLANLLQVSTLHADELLAGATTPEQRESAEQIRRASESGSVMVRELLSLGRGTPVAGLGFSANAVMAQLEVMLRGTLPSFIRTHYRCDDAVVLCGDAQRFEQVVINLALNARDAMPSGGELHITLTHAGPGSARLVVQDTGSGVSPDIRDKIFQPFFTTKTSGDGSGLGLSMVARIVAEVKGRIDVESTLGVGTTFTVSWPTCSHTEAT